MPASVCSAKRLRLTFNGLLQISCHFPDETLPQQYIKKTQRALLHEILQKTVT